MNDIELTELLAKREQYRSRVFRIMIELIFIFGVPAFAGLFIGKYLGGLYGESFVTIGIPLAVAFVFSWIIVIIRVVRIDGEMRDLDAKIKEGRLKKAEDQKYKG